MCLKAHLLQRVSLFMRLMHEIVLYTYLLAFSVTCGNVTSLPRTGSYLYTHINSLIYIHLLMHDLFCVYLLRIY